MSETGPNKNFEAKVASLIAATRHLDLPQILVLRRLTLRDPETRKWATDKQLGVVFTVIMTKAAERMGLDQLKLARDKNFAPMLPADTEARQQDLRLLTDLAMHMLGPQQRSEAENTQAGFEALLARGANTVTPPRTNRGRSGGPGKEPPPLFAAQVAPKGAKTTSPAKAMTQQQEGGAGKPIDFSVLFDDTICAYSRKIISLFRISGGAKGMRVPFLVAPDFADVYEEVLRRHVLPQMRSTRHVASLAMSYNWSEVGGDKLIDIIQGSEVNNPILHNWDARWNAFRTPKPVKKKAAVLKPEDNPWPLFREEATRGNYEPPREEHLQLLQDIIRQEADVIAKCWRELTQLYEQEFTPNARQEQAREGAFRDGVMKWSQKLPDHVGEHLAIRSYFDFERCDGHFMRRLAGNFGRNDSERRRNAPFLTDFVLVLPG
ncbi:MAG: hypothetical protein HYU60_07060 [Magnetospirillum sp.]|nr:hypothetical protein [Magnetospirillum sp.]